MAVTLPDCTHCDSANSLEVIRADTHGQKWCVCTVCGKPTVLDVKNRERLPPMRD